MTVDGLTLGETVGEHEYELLIACSKGLYVRTLIADIGEALGCGAAMSALRRLRAGGFSIEDAVTLERAAELAEAGRIAEAARGADVLFAELPALYLSARGETVIKHGAPWRTPLPDGGCRLYGPDGTFWAWAAWKTARRASKNLSTKGDYTMKKTCAAALGFFDGVHKAHLRVLQSAARYAAAHDMESVAVTFDRPPKAFVTGAAAPLICTDADRARVMREEAGIDRVVVLPFDAATRDLDARAFVEDVVLGELGAGYCAAGYDYRFGARGAGDAALLQTLCAARGVPCEIVGCLADGAEKSARPVSGADRLGRRRGRGSASRASLRFLRRSDPRQGARAYAGLPDDERPRAPGAGAPARGGVPSAVRWSRAHGGARYAILRMGIVPCAKCTLFNYGGDAYGLTIRVEFLDFVRGMRRFPSLEALTRQVECDKKLRLIGSLHGEAAFSLIFCGSFHYGGISRKMVS